ncbi:MAG: PD40 domain-containing protein [Aridibacter famidurans]|nr:PD40 domain-containing protein [Aridibacter famidurans]
MKNCPKCNRSYDDDSLNFCLDDGEWLIEEGSEARTRSFSPDLTEDPGEAPTRHKISKTDETAVLPTGAIDGELKRDGASSKRSYLFAGVAIVAVLLAAGYGLYKWSPFSGKGSDAPPPEFTTERLTGDGSVVHAAISPDGIFLAYLEVIENKITLRIKQIETNSTVEILRAGEFSEIGNLVFAPDNNFVYFAGVDREKLRSIYKVPTLGGKPIKIPISTGAFSLSPDGSLIAFYGDIAESTETNISVANSDGSEPRKIISRSGKKFLGGSTAWSPDGKRLVFVEGNDERIPDPLLSLGIYSFEDQSVKDLGTDRWEYIDGSGLVWSPSDNFIYLTGSRTGGETPQIFRVSVQQGNAIQLTGLGSSSWGLSITADGTRLVTTEEEVKTGIWVSPDLDPMNAVEVLPARGDTWSLDWTTDGRLVYVSDQSGAREVWVMDADGKNGQQLTNDRVAKSEPVVSPDGDTVLYWSPVEGFQIYKLPIGGGNPSRMDTGAVGPNNPVFSPDGKFIAFDSWPEGMQSIFRMPAEGGRAERLTDYFSLEPSYSPDGSRIACFFLDGKDQFLSLAIIPAEGGTPIRKFEVPVSVISSRGSVWTPDGKQITYLVRDGEKTDLWAQSVEGGDPVRLSEFSRPWIQRWAYSKDGKRIAISRGQGLRNAVMLKLKQ